MSGEHVSASVVGSSVTASSATLLRIRDMERQLEEERRRRRAVESTLHVAVGAGPAASSTTSRPPQTSSQSVRSSRATSVPGHSPHVLPLTESNMRIIDTLSGRAPMALRIPSHTYSGPLEKGSKGGGELPSLRSVPVSGGGGGSGGGSKGAAAGDKPSRVVSAEQGPKCAREGSRKPPIPKGNVVRSLKRHPKKRPPTSDVWAHQQRQSANELRFLFRDNWS